MTATRPAPSLADIPTFTLKAGTPLWHGTDSGGEFDHPDGPAWFAFDLETAVKWAGWSEKPAEGRAKGDRRILGFEAGRDIVLLDTRKVGHWETLCEFATGDPEGGPWAAAEAIARLDGVQGWYGNSEAMLVAPATMLTPKGVVWTATPGGPPSMR